MRSKKASCSKQTWVGGPIPEESKEELPVSDRVSKAIFAKRTHFSDSRRQCDRRRSTTRLANDPSLYSRKVNKMLQTVAQAIKSKKV
jgi:hypothetical protein